MTLTVSVADIVESSKNPLLGKHESWGRVMLGDIATIQNGFPFQSSQFSKNGGMPLIRIRDVGADRTDTNYIGDYDPDFVVKLGDLLIGMDGDFNCARWRGPKGLLNQRVCRVILKSGIYHPKLLDYALPGYLKAINDMTSSVTVKHLSSKSIAEIPLPLPPIDQQKHIVAEIEKQFSRLNEAVANLKRVKANLKRYKAAVLKAAVEGRLVETEASIAHKKTPSPLAGEGRGEGVGYETGKQLLQRILETRRSKWKGKGKYKEPAAPDTTHLPELPEGWTVATLDAIAKTASGGTPRRDRSSNYGGGIPWVKSGELGDSVVTVTEETISIEGLESSSAKVFPKGTLCIALYGATVGKLGVLGIDAATNQAVCGVFPIEGIDKSYLKLYLEAIRGKLIRLGQGGAQPNISQEILRNLVVPIPSVAEQVRIVSEVDRCLSLIRETEAQVDVSIKRAERLHQSVLHTAFSSEFITRR